MGHLFLYHKLVTGKPINTLGYNKKHHHYNFVGGSKEEVALEIWHLAQTRGADHGTSDSIRGELP